MTNLPRLRTCDPIHATARGRRIGVFRAHSRREPLTHRGTAAEPPHARPLPFGACRRHATRRSPPPYSTASVRVLRLPAGDEAPDRLAVEEPLEIRIDGEPVAVTMRTPGHDEELALGFCLTEGMAPGGRARARRPGGEHGRGRRAGRRAGATSRGRFYTSSSCGVCGKGAIEAVQVDAPRVESELRVPLAVVTGLPEALRAAQATFEATGGLHATGSLLARRRAALPARGRRPAQRDGQGDRLGVPRGPPAARATRFSASAAASRSSSCRRRRSPAARSSSRSARRRRWRSSSPPIAGSRSAASCATDGERLHRAVAHRLTGVLLVGGASERFGSPKALARLGGETLAERGWRVLDGGLRRGARRRQGSGCAAAAVPALDDGAAERAPVFGVVAGLRAAANEVCVMLPVDCVAITPEALRALGEAVAVPQTGPLPGAYGRSMLPLLEERIARGELSLRGVNPTTIELAIRASVTSTRRRTSALPPPCDSLLQGGVERGLEVEAGGGHVEQRAGEERLGLAVEHDEADRACRLGLRRAGLRASPSARRRGGARCAPSRPTRSRRARARTASRSSSSPPSGAAPHPHRGRRALTILRFLHVLREQCERHLCGLGCETWHAAAARPKCPSRASAAR